jgi:demethylmenaquinone methyltransferase/2-methoxy-6-polyprenyl-1,4-benzoquinol methylase
VPWIADRLGADAVAYRYLPESSRHFPDPPVLAQMLRDTGWSQVEYQRLPPGAVALHVAHKPGGDTNATTT